MSSFDITDIILEVVVNEGFDIEPESYVSSFKHAQSGKELVNFEMVGSWLCDIEYEVRFPREPGKYRMKAEYNDTTGILESIYDIELIGKTEENDGIK
ncbi:hypothetical protein [Mesobacillus zeae]|uniref:Uncharacterized protein n=1 Tax=Mesobacillus zeae TaxID=1917180 RepID=A0A398BNN6_9BACI|nr:hypothetical protein [Mesobacillus zeae]RID88966.1 hypothetical protein D1970_00245 [Mesobacillus zeae]